MIGKTHAAIGVASIVPFIPNERLEYVIFIPFALLGALIPDIDADYSLIKSKKYIRFFSVLAVVILLVGVSERKIFSMVALLVLIFIMKRSEHRTATHSLMGVFLFSICIFLCAKNCIVPFVVGYFSHLVADSFTISGVPLLYPKQHRYGLKRIQTGDFTESLIRIVCFAVIFFKIASIID